MFKPFLIILISVTSFFAAAEDTFMPPLKAIERFGDISISDGSSYFTFSKDGTFQSGPLEMSGRVMTGRWSTDTNGLFVATVKLDWINGISTGDQYRRIVFYIAYVSKRSTKLKSLFAPPASVYDSYFFIDELTKIQKP